LMHQQQVGHLQQIRHLRLQISNQENF